MNILLDTHIILWALNDDCQLPPKAKQLILNRENRIFFSVISLWEIEIKRLKQPAFINMTAKKVSTLCKSAGYTFIPLKEEPVHQLQYLKRKPAQPPHKDPFDKMLLCQAVSENMFFLTHDSLINGYDSKNIIFV